MTDGIGERTVPVDGSEVEAAAKRVADAAEELEAALEELDQAAIRMGDPITGRATHVEVSELLDLHVSVNIAPSGGPQVVCPRCDRRVWDDELQEELMEDW